MNNAIEGIVIFTACAAFIAFLVFIAAAIVYMLTVTVALIHATLPERAPRARRASIASVRPRRGPKPITGATEARALLAAPGEAEGEGAQRGPNPLVRARDGIAQRREAPAANRLGAHRREWQVRRTSDSPMTAAELAHKAAVSPSSARRKIKDWEAQIPPEPTMEPVDVPDTPTTEPVDVLGIFGGEEVDKN